MTVICYACIKDKESGELSDIKRIDDMRPDELKRFKEELILEGAISSGYQLKK